MKNKLIGAFAIIGAIAGIAGVVCYILKIKKEFDNMLPKE